VEFVIGECGEAGGRGVGGVHFEKGIVCFGKHLAFVKTILLHPPRIEGRTFLNGFLPMVYVR
jgi:hypothetical protein